MAEADPASRPVPVAGSALETGTRGRVADGATEQPGVVAWCHERAQ